MLAYRFVLLSAAAALLQMQPITNAQEQGTPTHLPELKELDASDLGRQLRDREDKIHALSAEEEEMLRAAHIRAAQDSEVKAALAKREEAAQEFVAAVQASMLKAEPSLKALLDATPTPLPTPPAGTPSP